MKKNDVIIGLSAITCTFLLYEHTPGINLLVFNALLIALLYYFNRPISNLRYWLLYVAASLFASTMVLVIHSGLSIFASFCSYLLLIAKTAEPGSSIVISMIQGVISFFDHHIASLGRLGQNKVAQSDSGKRVWYKWAAGTTAVFGALIFLFLFADASPLFKNILPEISFEWLSFGHVVFTLFFFVILNTFKPLRPYLPLLQWDLQARKKALHADEEANPGSVFSQFTAFFIPVLFALINLMLLLINVMDIDNIFISHSLPAHLSLSDFVHNGVWSLVFSIVLAILVIQLLYHPKQYSNKQNTRIKFLLYGWAGQSLLMIFSTAIRNGWYVEGYGLTYLRIGVFVFLLLASIGLCLTALQIRFERSAWQLFSLNLESWFAILILSSGINWDVRITEYNLQHCKKDRIDWAYLMDLSEGNIPLLVAYDRANPYKIPPLGYSLEDKIEAAKRDFYADQDWRSFNFRDQKLAAILHLNK